MSMDVSLRLLLYFLFIAYTQAGPLSTGSPTSLTPYLAENVPICAQPCLQEFVGDSFPSSVCSSPSIDCLCTSDSETGFTIGEGALSCLASNCPQWDQDEAVSAYDVCSNVAGAIPGTHTIITATPTGVTSTSSTASTTSTSRTSRSTSVTSSTKKLSTSSSDLSSLLASSTNTISSTPTLSSSSSVTPPSSSSITAAPVSTAPSPSPSPMLSKAQTAGIVVASVGAAALALGLAFLLFCCRRRKQVKRHSGSSFGGDKLVGSSANSTPDLAIVSARDWGHDPEGKEVVAKNGEASEPRLSPATPQTTGEGGWSQWRRNTAPQDIGLALAPGPLTPRHSTPITPSSRRTRNSQLLPDKPSYSLFPQPLRPSPLSRRGSQSLEAQLASPNPSGAGLSPPPASSHRFPSSFDTSQTYMQGESSSRSPSSPPQIFPYMQAAQPQAEYQPYRKTPIPDSKVGPHWTELSGVPVPKPLPAHASLSGRGLRLGQTIHSQYSSSPRLRPPPPPPIDPQHHVGASTNAPRRKKSDSRPSTWFSTGSETSFEDADDFPEPVSALTPVQEQPNPITYPRVPTTAAESPRRRPRLADRSDSLLARRRGESRAAELAVRPGSTPAVVPQSAKSQILQSPLLSEPLVTGSSSSNSPRRMGKGAGLTPPPSGWPVRT